MTNDRTDPFKGDRGQAVRSRSGDTGDFYDGTMKNQGPAAENAAAVVAQISSIV